MGLNRGRDQLFEKKIEKKKIDFKRVDEKNTLQVEVGSIDMRTYAADVTTTTHPNPNPNPNH